MFHVVLHRPEIPPNTGNAIRLCANSGCDLHLIEPLGFTLDDARLRRAGLDYHEWARVRVHATLEAFRESVRPRRLFALSTSGTRSVFDTAFRPGDALLFGRETAGLPAAVLEDIGRDNVLRVPMCPGVRSINLSNAVAVVVYEAWRQQEFKGGA